MLKLLIACFWQGPLCLQRARVLISPCVFSTRSIVPLDCVQCRVRGFSGKFCFINFCSKAGGTTQTFWIDTCFTGRWKSLQNDFRSRGTDHEWFVQFLAFGKSGKIEIFTCCLQNSIHFGHKSTHFGQKVSLNYHSYKIRILKWAFHSSDSLMPFTRYMYTFPELGLHCAFFSSRRTLKLGFLSNLSWLSKRLYNFFFSKNLIQSLGSWAQNVCS